MTTQFSKLRFTILVVAILLSMSGLFFFGIRPVHGGVIYNDSGLTVSHATEDAASETESHTFSENERLMFMTSDPLSVIRSEIVPPYVDLGVAALLAALYGDLGDELEASEFIKSVSVDAAKKKVTFDLEDYLIANEIEEIRIFKRDKDDDGKKDKNSGIKLCTLNTYVWLKDAEMTIKLDDMASSFRVSDKNTLNPYVDLPTSKLTGDLSVKLTCGSISIHVIPEITITGFGFDFEAEFEGTEDDAIAIKKISSPDLNIDSVDINSEDLGIIKEAITGYGIDYFVDEECKENEEFEDCVSRQIINGIGKETIIEEIQSLLADAWPEALKEGLNRDVEAEISGIDVSSNVSLTSLSFSDDEPYVDTFWQTETTFEYPASSCMADLVVPEQQAAILTLPADQGESEAFFLFPKDLISNAAYAFLKSGTLCFDVSYTDPTYGVTFTGPLQADGGMTVEKSSYESVLYIFSNYESYFSEMGMDPEGRLEDDEDEVFPLEVRATRPDAVTPSSGIGSTVSTRSLIRDKRPGVLSEYDLEVSSYTADAFLIKLPVRFTSTKNYMGQDLTLDLSGILNVYGMIEPDGDEGLKFYVKKAEVTNLAGNTQLTGSFGTMTVSLPNFTANINAALAQTFYTSRTQYVTYYDCEYSNNPDTLKMGVWGVSTTLTENNCEEDCEFPLGSKDHSLTTHGYTLRTDHFDLQGSLGIIGLNSQTQNWSTSEGCTETSYGLLDGVNTRIEDMIAMGKLAELITRYSIYEGMLLAEQTQQQIEALLERIRNGTVIIDENPYPEEELVQIQNFVGRIENVYVQQQGDLLRNKLEDSLVNLVRVNRFNMIPKKSNLIQSNINKVNIRWW